MNKESSVLVKKLTVGHMGANCYIVFDSKSREAVVIDPGDEASYLAEQIQALEVKPVTIVATHGHFDHILAALELQLIYNIPFYMCHEDQFLLDRMHETAEHFSGHKIVEMPPKITRSLSDGDDIKFGENILAVLATPGHTPGSVCFFLKKQDILFVGDTIFEGGGVGRTDFSYSQPLELSSSIKRIISLDDRTVLYPGHGEDSTVLKERPYHNRIF